MPTRDFIAELLEDYRLKRPEIERRLAEFRAVYEAGDRAIFEEMCYCILTAGSSARMGMRTVEALRDILFTGSERELQNRAKKTGVRFWRVRPSYIFQTREYLREVCGLRLKRLIDSLSDPDERRDFFAKNKAIKGLGYKEASHFLRNIGFRGYAILDKHIIQSLKEAGVISQNDFPSNPERYKWIEIRMAAFAKEIGIDMDHMDLLLWSRKTGEILK